MSRKSGIVLLLLAILLFFAGCGGEDNPDENGQAEIPAEITDIESELLSIMQQADLIPVVLSKQGQPDNGEAEQGNEDDQEETDENEEKSNGEAEEAIAKVNELTFEETILGPLLEKEADAEGINEEEELPESTEIIWNDIKESVEELHNRWNDLEPLLLDENITQDVIDDFAEGLDNLTVFSTIKDHFGAMDTANQLTGHLSKFMAPFSENIVSLSYGIKFHIRNIVLQAFKGDYAGAQESLNYIKEQRPVLAKELDEAAFGELESSLENLQRVLDKQNLDLIILNAAVVMKNMVQVIEKTTA